MLRPFAVIAAAALMGCLRTTLKPESPLPKVQRLAAFNTRPIELEVRSALSSTRLGHQYLLVFFPFGSVHLEDPRGYVASAAYTKLSLRGYRPRLIAPEDPRPAVCPRLVITLTYLQASAYDLLFLRRLVCRLDAVGELVAPDGRRLRYWEGSGEASALKEFGFAPQLETLLDEAAAGAIDEILYNLRI